MAPGGSGMTINLWIVIITISLTCLVGLIEGVLNRPNFPMSAMVISLGMLVLQHSILYDKMLEAEATGRSLMGVLAASAENMPGIFSVFICFTPLASGLIAAYYAYLTGRMGRSETRETGRMT